MLDLMIGSYPDKLNKRADTLPHGFATITACVSGRNRLRSLLTRVITHYVAYLRSKFCINMIILHSMLDPVANRYGRATAGHAYSDVTLKTARWPKSINVSKVQAYYSASESDHLIRKNFSGLCRDSHCFEEYLKIIETFTYVHFFE